jgi:hypothetical protein
VCAQAQAKRAKCAWNECTIVQTAAVAYLEHRFSRVLVMVQELVDVVEQEQHALLLQFSEFRVQMLQTAVMTTL